MAAKKTYTPEHITWLKNVDRKMSWKEITALFNETFKMNKTIKSIGAKLIDLGINVDKRFIFSDEMRAYLLEINRGRTSVEVARLMSEKFNMIISKDYIIRYRKNHRIPCGVDTTFKKGHTPANKGMKSPGVVNSGCFVKGQVPWNVAPIGTERISKDGYVYVKVSRGEKGKNYKQKHRVVWEEHHGPVPKGHLVIFIDQNKRNFDINNLMLVSYREMSRINKGMKLTDDKDLNLAKVYTIKIQEKIKKEKKKRDEND